MRKLTGLFAVVVVIAAVVAVQALAATPTVSWHVGTKKALTIRKGQSVKWVWTGDSTHNVKGKGFKSPAHTAKGATYTHTFRTKGKFTITCTFHPGLMKTIVKVG